MLLPFVRRLLNDPMRLLSPLIIFAVTLLVGWIVRRVILRALRAWTNRTNSKPGLILYNMLQGPMLIWIVILAAHLAIQGSALPARYTAWTAKGLLVLWFLSLTVMSMRIAGGLVRHYGAQVPGALPVTTLTQNLAQLGVFILGVVLILGALDVKITPILTALGVGGLAVALALAGYAVEPVRRILCGGGGAGPAGRLHPAEYRRGGIRHGHRLAQHVGAGAGEQPDRDPELEAGTGHRDELSPAREAHGDEPAGRVDYESDPDQVEKVLLEVARQGAEDIPGLLAEPAAAVMFDPGFGDSALGFTLNFHVAEFSNQYRVRHELRKRILRRFREEGIGIPFPTRTVYLAGGNAQSQADGSSAGASPLERV